MRGFQDLARGLLRREIPAVVAMQFSISDTAGLIFAENLYPRLVEGRALDVAISAARRAVLRNDDERIQGDALAPVLFVSNNQPLRMKQAEAGTAMGQPEIDFSLHLPLPRLGFGFYGRRREYRAIRDGIVARNHRAVIVYGIGGIGKTALISHTATRLQKQFKGVYAFDCSSGTLAPETILLELHRWMEGQGIEVLGQLLHKSIPPEKLAGFVGQVLSQVPYLLIFDNFETHLAPQDGDRHKISNENLDVFLKTLVKTTATGTRFLFTTRYLFDLDAKRIGDIQEVSLGDLSRPEALGLMQHLPHLSGASFKEKLKAFETFGGHPYALVTLDRHCGHRPLADVLQDAQGVHAELREFLAIELNYGHLSERSKKLLTHLAAFRKSVPVSAAEWALGETVEKGRAAREFFKREREKLVDEIANLTEEEFAKEYGAIVPEAREAKDVGQPIDELINWGLLTPMAEGDEVGGLAVHSLVRDFCRDKVGDETWQRNLCDAAAYYTNQTKLQRQDQKTPAAVWMEIEAFKLLCEAEQYEQAASVLIAADPLLDRWGFGRLLETLYERIMSQVEGKTQSNVIHNLAVLLQSRGDYDKALHYYEQSLKTKEELGDRAGISSSLHQIGMVHQQRGDYDKALHYYEKSLQTKEALGDRAGMAKSHAQIGVLLIDTKRYPKAFEHSFTAMAIQADMAIPNLCSAPENLARLRKDWGAANFDKAWREKTGEDVPEWLRQV